MSIQDFIKEEFEKAGIEIPIDEVIDFFIESVEIAFLKISEIIESFIAFIRQTAVYCFNELRKAFDEAYINYTKIDKRKSSYVYKRNVICFENKKCLLRQTKCLNLYRLNKHLIRHKLTC